LISCAFIFAVDVWLAPRDDAADATAAATTAEADVLLVVFDEEVSCVFCIFVLL
jgi:hypothetical protein